MPKLIDADLFDRLMREQHELNLTKIAEGDPDGVYAGLDRGIQLAGGVARGMPDAIDPETLHSIRFAVALMGTEAQTYPRGGRSRALLWQHTARLTALADLGEKADRAAEVLLRHERGGESR